MRHLVRPQDPQPVELLPVDGLIALGDLGLGAALGPGLVDDLVVDVGDVAHMEDVEAAPLQRPADGVERERAAGVADVGHVVDRRAADVERDLPRLARNQFDFVGGERVVDEHPDQATGARLGSPMDYLPTSASSSLASASSSVTPMAKVSSDTRI